MQTRGTCQRRRKVLNIWAGGGGGGGGRGGGGQGSEYWEGGKGGGKLFTGCKLIGVPALQSVPDNYMHAV